MPGDKPLIRCERHGAVAVLVLDNPPLNVVTLGLTAELDAALRRLRADTSVRALVLTGAGGRAFCAGSDIGEFAALAEPGRAVDVKLARQNRVLRDLHDFPKPTLAAVAGLALGGGLEIALCCDLILAEASARFGLPELRLGVFPSSGGTWRLARRVGEGRARQLMFTTESIDAARAEAWGLVNQVVPAGSVLSVAIELAAGLAERPPQALALCKEMIGMAFELPESALLVESLARSDRAFSSAECREGVRAFFAKEAPRFAASADSSDP